MHITYNGNLPLSSGRVDRIKEIHYSNSNTKRKSQEPTKKETNDSNAHAIDLVV